MHLVAEHFRRIRALEQSKLHDRRKWFVAAKERKARKEELAEEAEAAVFGATASIVMADPVELEAFTLELDAFDEATIKAILENREILERLYLECDTMFNQAYQLDDGTRVFKSEDGVTVITEFGDKIATNVIDPNVIEDHRPSAEAFMDLADSIKHHEEIDQQLHDYQAQLDEACEQVNSGELTQTEFKELRQSLYADMPDQVREYVVDEYKPERVSLHQAFNAPAPTPNVVDQVPSSAAQYSLKDMPSF